jgi:dolichol kinase
MMIQFIMNLELIILSFCLLVIVLIATRSLVAECLIMFSFLSVLILVIFGSEPGFIIISGILLLFFLLILLYAMRSGFFKFVAGRDIRKWRIFARPFALLFIPIDIFIGHQSLLILLGCLALIIVGLDIFRIFSKKQFSAIFKQKEAMHFSSMTSFLVSSFIVFLLFPQHVAYLCLVFILFGDLLSKLIGIKYGRINLIHGRTLEGSLGFLAGCLYAGIILYAIFGFNILWLITGSIVATFTELFSWKIDDNFSVGIITGTVLLCLKYFSGLIP